MTDGHEARPVVDNCMDKLDPTFKACIDRLDAISELWTTTRRSILNLTQYESDRAGLRLMHNVYVHVNAISHIATIPYTGSHLVSAWVLSRAVFETAVTAIWLCKNLDWKLRELRWIAWIEGEESYWKGRAHDERADDQEYALEIDQHIANLKHERLRITARLPQNSAVRKPSFREMITDVGMPLAYYRIYRLASQIAHAGPGCTELSIRENRDCWDYSLVVKPSQWADVFCLASWCICSGGAAVLARHGVNLESIARLYPAHDAVVNSTRSLNP